MTRTTGILISIVGAFLLGCAIAFSIAVQPQPGASYYEPVTPSRPSMTDKEIMNSYRRPGETDDQVEQRAADVLNKAFGTPPSGEIHDCDNDGVALESAAHPQDMRFIERLARRACEAEGVDPDKIGEGLGQSMPLGVKYPLWKARVKIVQAILDEMAIADAELAEKSFKPSVLTTENMFLVPGEMIQVENGETLREAIERAQTGVRKLRVAPPEKGFRAWLKRIYG